MLNKTVLIGNLCADPELRYTGSGTEVASFTVATSEKWKGQDGTMQESTEFHRCVAWKQKAVLCAEYLKKGSRVYLEGSLKTRKWQDQNGVDKYTTEHIIKDVKFLSPKDEPGQRNYSESGGHIPDAQDSSVPF